MPSSVKRTTTTRRAFDDGFEALTHCFEISSKAAIIAPRLSFVVTEASSRRTFCSAAGSRSYGLCHAVFDLQKLTTSPRDEHVSKTIQTLPQSRGRYFV